MEYQWKVEPPDWWPMSVRDWIWFWWLYYGKLPQESKGEKS